MSKSFNNLIFQDFQKAIKKLKEVLELEKTEITRDSALKRFELCFDLAWKNIKTLAKQEGIECYSPRECFKAGFQIKLIQNPQKWIEMIEDRNKIVHIYKEEYADQVYEKLKNYLEMFKELEKEIEKRLTGDLK